MKVDNQSVSNRSLQSSYLLDFVFVRFGFWWSICFDYCRTMVCLI